MPRDNRSVRKRLEELEASLGGQEPETNPEVSENVRQFAEECWRGELEVAAGALVNGEEPDLTFRDDAFYTPDGRFAVSPTAVDLRELMGPGRERNLESMPPERWYEFRDADPRARELLEELEDLANEAEPPRDYTREIDDEPEPGDLTRSLSWILLDDPKARILLSELCRRRDEWLV